MPEPLAIRGIRHVRIIDLCGLPAAEEQEEAGRFQAAAAAGRRADVQPGGKTDRHSVSFRSRKPKSEFKPTTFTLTVNKQMRVRYEYPKS